MKKGAWTLMELFIALLVIILISSIGFTIFRPDIQKAKFYVYATIANLTKGNIALLEKYSTIKSADMPGEDDWYCLHLTDNYSLGANPNCARSSGVNDVNIEFPNGVTVKGIASEWQQPYEGASFEYKNILVDIDGEEGSNKLWLDQFPLRIIAGSGKGAEGMIMPVNCDNEKVYNLNTSALVPIDNAAKNPYCPAANGKNYTLDDQVILFDIYRAKTYNEESPDKNRAEIIAALLSPMEADCMAYGGSGYFSAAECDEANIKMNPKCASQTNCANCTANTCPEGSTNPESCVTLAQTTNPEDLPCAAAIHKPSGGMSFIVESLIGNINDL